MPESWQAVAEEIPESKQMTKVKDIQSKRTGMPFSRLLTLPSELLI